MDVMTVGSMVWAAADAFGEKPCVVSKDRTITFAVFRAEVVGLARYLKDVHGVEHGDRVGILDVNSIGHLEALCAVSSMGAVAVPLNYKLTSQEMLYQLRDAGAKLLLFGEQYAEFARQLSMSLDIPAEQLSANGFEAKAGNGSHNPSLPFTPASEDAMAICYTSGTTGVPKGAIITHRASYMRAMAMQSELRLSHDDVAHVATPLFHISHLNLSLLCLMRGVTQVFTGQFEPRSTLRTMRDEAVTFLMAVPTMLQMMMDCDEWENERLGSVQLIMYTGSPASMSMLRELMEQYRGQLIQFLGQTEDLPQTALPPEDHEAGKTRPGILETVGRPSMGVNLRIISADGEDCPVGVVGEIITKSPTAMAGYWNRPDESAQTLRAGWVYSGDLGIKDESGRIHIRGRSKHTIIRGGENVYPAEVEAALASHPAVKECAVFGLPDDRWGESVAAGVSLQQGVELELSELISYCRDRVARYKCPTNIFLCDDFPRTATGKILHHKLREQFTDETTAWKEGQQ